MAAAVALTVRAAPPPGPHGATRTAPLDNMVGIDSFPVGDEGEVNLESRSRQSRRDALEHVSITGYSDEVALAIHIREVTDHA